MRVEHEKIIKKSREDNKRIKDLENENDELKKSIYQNWAKEGSLTNSDMEYGKQRSETSTRELEKQTRGQEYETSAKHYKATIMLRERNRKINNLSEENERLKKNIDDMQMEINQLDMINKELYMHNNCLTELCSRGKIHKRVETGGEEGAKEHGGQVKGRTINTQTKCYFYENMECTKENCKFCPPEIECEDLKKKLRSG